MAASEERAERIRDLKSQRPDLTWDRIADYCGVKERSAIEWSRTGGISHENCERLAVLFDVDSEWLWSGRTRAPGTGDLMGALSPDAPVWVAALETQITELSASVSEIRKALGDVLGAKPTPSTPADNDHATPRPASPPARETRTRRTG